MVGLLLGLLMVENGQILCCFNAGTVVNSGNGNNPFASGIGSCDYATIESCYNIGDVTCTGTGGNVAFVAAGGITAQGSPHSIYEHCYNSGNVSIKGSRDGENRKGSISGFCSGTFINCLDFLNEGTSIFGSGNDTSFNQNKVIKVSSEIFDIEVLGENFFKPDGDDRPARLNWEKTK